MWKKDSKDLESYHTVITHIDYDFYMYVYKAYEYDNHQIILKVLLEETNDNMEKLITEAIKNGGERINQNISSVVTFIRDWERTHNSTVSYSEDGRTTLYDDEISDSELGHNRGKSFENGGKNSESDTLKSKPTVNYESTKKTSNNSSVVTSRFEIDTEGQAKLDELVKKYGAVKKGVAPTRDVTLPKRTSDDKYVRQSTRTAIESDRISDEVARELIDAIANGDDRFTYRRENNNKSLKMAESLLKTEGYEATVKRWNAMVESGNTLTAKDMAIATVLIEEASKRGDQKTAVNLIVDTASVRTNAAQVVQSTIALKKLGTAANIMKIERAVNNLQTELNKKYGVKAPKLKLSKSLMEDYAEAFDAEVRGNGTDALNKVADIIARQVPGVDRNTVLDMLKTAEGKPVANEKPSSDNKQQKQKHKWVNQEEYYRAIDELTETYNELYEKENIMTSELEELNDMQKQVDRVQRKITKLSEDLVDAEDAYFRAESEYDKAMQDYNEALRTKEAVNEAKEKAELAKQKAERAKQKAKELESHMSEYEESFDNAMQDYNEALRKIEEAKQQKLISDEMKHRAESAQKKAQKWEEKYKKALQDYDNAKADFDKAWSQYLHNKELRDKIKAEADKNMSTANKNMTALQNVINKLQEQLDQKYGLDKDGNSKKKIDIDKGTIEMYGQALLEEEKANTDHSESDKILDEIYTDIAGQMPVTWMDKFNAWRYLAMLGNPRTHLRNFFGNILFSPLIMTKNILAASGEAGAALIAKARGKEHSRTKSLKGLFAGGETYKYAKADAKKIESILRGDGKYSEMSVIKQKQKVFKTLKFLNSWIDFNSKALEAEDWFALKKHYARALTSYMYANKLNGDNITSEQLEKARIYAINEAQKATFRDDSSIANALASAGKQSKVLGVFIEANFPFKKTPVNVVRRGIDYSPLGIITTISKSIKGVKQGKYSVNEMLNDLAATFSGTLICVLGVALASQDMLVGPEDDEEKEKFAALNGMQNYALKIGNSTYTIDWLAPAALPLFMGVEFWKALDDGSLTFADIGDSLPKIISPVFDMTMLDGLMSSLETITFYDNPVVGATSAVVQMPFNLAGQAVPTALGQLARTIDPTRRKTYIDKSSWLPQWAQSFYQQQAKKIPGLTYALTPYVNAKGETEVNAEGNVLARAFQNFLSPGYWKSIKSTKVDDEINRLYDKLGVDASGIIPKTAEKKIKANGEDVYLSDEQWVEYQTVSGKTYYEKLDAIVDSKFYKNLSDEKKVELITQVKAYATDIGRQSAVPEYKISKDELKAYLDNGLFEYIIDPEEKEGTFSTKDFDSEKYKSYVAERDKLFNDIISNYKYGVSDYKLNDKFYDNVYSYAHKISLEKYSGGKYVNDTVWMRNAKTLTPKELSEYFYGKGIISSFDGQEDAQEKANEAIVSDKKISAKVKTFLLQKSFGSNYDSGVMYDKYVKKYNVDPATYGELWQYKNMSDSDEVKKADVLRKINNTKGLTNEQKSAIYRSFGWKETPNALRGVPWKYVAEPEE